MGDIKPFEIIVEREFRKAAKIPDDVPVTVEFTEDETIIVTYADQRFVMEIGSDDDYFWFHNEATNAVVTFDYPDDWPEV